MTATTICLKAFITSIRLTVPAHDVPASDVFGSVIFLWHLVSQNRRWPHTLRLLFACTFPHFTAWQVSRYGNWTVYSGVCYNERML